MPEMDPAELASTPPPEDEEALVARAQDVISRILEREHDPNPNPRLLRALATMCELHEARSGPHDDSTTCLLQLLIMPSLLPNPRAFTSYPPPAITPTMRMPCCKTISSPWLHVFQTALDAPAISFATRRSKLTI
jgi:hypothetical protein